MEYIRTIAWEDQADDVLDVKFEELRVGDSLESRFSAYRGQTITGIRSFSVQFSRSGWVNRAYIEMLPGSSIRIYRKREVD